MKIIIWSEPLSRKSRIRMRRLNHRRHKAAMNIYRQKLAKMLGIS